MSDQPDDDYAALKRKLLGRIAFAVVILAGLLASLAAFDRMNAPEPAPEQRASAPQSPAPAVPATVPPASDTIKSQQNRPDVAPPDAVVEAAPVAVPEGSATPQSAAPPVIQAEKPLTRPATGRHALMRAPDVAAAPQPRSDQARGPAPSRPVSPAPRGSEPTRPLAQGTDRPFALQVGVFSDLANAEELRARLEMAGIKASIEARVQVGPFATRAEADAARAKLRELGLADTLLLSTKGRKAP